jgi:hypothetical protein
MKTPPLSVTRRQILRALAAVAAATTSASAEADSRDQGDHRMASDDRPDAQRAEIMKALERYVAAWRAGDLAALTACYHDDFTLHYFGRSPLAGDHRGRSAALRVLSDVSRRTNRRLVAIIDVMAGRRRGAIVAREAFQRETLKAEVDRVLVYTVQDGQLHECWVYDADQELVDRFLA